MISLPEYPLVSVVIPIGGNRNGDTNNLLACVNSICQQDYPRIEVILVIDQSNSVVKNLQFPCPVVILEYKRPVNTSGRDQIAKYRFGWNHARGDILASTGTGLFWKSDVVSTALLIMAESDVEAVDGISRRQIGSGFIGKFQDDSLISEFSLFKRDFLLNSETFAADLRLPALTSFFMTRQYYLGIKDLLPSDSPDGWSDFNIARAIIDAGKSIYVTNRLISYRSHKINLRLAKQFTSGLAGMKFYFDYPENSYAKKRLGLTILVALLEIYFLLTTSILSALFPLLGVSIFIGAITLIFILAGIYNAVKVKYLVACLFPPLTALQITIWTLGYVYGGMSDFNIDAEFVSFLHQSR